MKTLKIYGTGSATANAVAQVIIPNSSTIRGIQWAVSPASVVNASRFQIELSRASATEIAVNGAQQCISEIGIYSNFVTSGLMQTGVNAFFPVAIQVTQGQIIYMHVLIAGTMTYIATALLHYD